MARFQPGQSGNPRGRPAGSRNKLGEQFLSALQLDFETNGAATIAKVRTEKPDAYLKVIASLMPRDITVSKPDPFEDWSDEDLEEMLALLHSQLDGLKSQPIDAGEGFLNITTREGNAH